MVVALIKVFISPGTRSSAPTASRELGVYFLTHLSFVFQSQATVITFIHWTSVEFLRVIDLGLVFQRCWVLSVHKCELWDQFLQIRSKMIFVWDWVSVVRDAPPSPCPCISHACAGSWLCSGGAWQSRGPDGPRWLGLLRALSLFETLSSNSFHNDSWVSEKSHLKNYCRNGSKVFYHCVAIGLE